MAKRVLSIILALTMIMSLCCTVSFAAGVVVSAAADTNNTVNGNAGANITVPVSITGNTAGINNYKVYLVYDSDYLSPVVTDNSCLDASIAGFSGLIYDNPKATYSGKTAVGVTYSSVNNVTGDQKLFGCIFKIKETITRRCETTVKVYVEELTKMNSSTYANEDVSHTTQDATVIINPDVLTPVTITLSNLTKTYNATAQGATVSLSENVTHTVKYNGSTTLPTNAGTYDVEVAVTQDGFSGTKTGTFVIEPEPITLAANDASKYEGQPDPALTVRHVSGTFYGTDTYTGTPVRDSGTSCGAYAIKQGTVSVGSNYKLTFNEGTFEIKAKKNQNIYLEPVATGKRYGDAPFRWSHTLDETSGCTTKSFSSSDTNVATIDNDGNITIVGAGTTTLGMYVNGNEVYQDYETAGTFIVAKRPISITIDDKIEVVGSDAPTLTYQALASGALATGDTMNLQLERERGNALDTPYKIKVKSLQIKNASNKDVTDSYDINVTEGTYKIINKTPQEVTVGTIATSKTYGDAPFTFTITDNETHITGDISVTSSNSDVATISSYSEGVVTVTVKNAGTTTITVTRAGDETYADLNVSETLNVAKRPLKITGNTITEKIGKSVPSLDGQYTIDTTTPLVTGDSISGSLVYEGNVDMSAMGVYQILRGTLGEDNDNYEITYTPGVLMVVLKTPQTITLEDIPEKTYGDSKFMLTADISPARPGYIPRFSATVSASATEQIPTNVATVDADGYVTITGAGTAYITVTEPGDEDYAPASATKTLVVKKAPLTISANVTDIVYGQTLTAPALSYSGFVNGETKDVLTTDATISGVPTGDRIAAGSYTITVSGATAANYDITHTPATLVVSKKPVSITGVGVFDKAYDSTTYAQLNPTKITMDGILSGDDVQLFVTASSCTFESETVGADKNVTVSMSAYLTGEDKDNYNLTLANEYTTTASILQSITAQNIADQISGPINVPKGDTELTLPRVPSGFSIRLKTSDNTDALATDGTVTPGAADTTVNVTFEVVSTTDDTDVGTTASIAVNVPKATKKTVTVTYSGIGSVSGNVGEQDFGTLITITATPASGYKTGEWTVNGTSIGAVGDEYSFTLREDTTITVDFEKKGGTYRPSGNGGGGTVYRVVTFNSNGGTAVEQQKVENSGKITAPKAPTKDGYVFAGWYTDSALKNEYDFDSKVTSSFTLYAAWKVDNTKNQIILVIGSKDMLTYGELKANDVAPIIVNDRTMLPTRFVAENLGATVEWDEATSKVTITKGDVVIELVIGAETATVNGETVTLDSPAFLENGRTYTPIRFVSEALGATVEWDEATQTVTITKAAE